MHNECAQCDLRRKKFSPGSVMMVIRDSALVSTSVAGAAHFDFAISPRGATLAARRVSVPGERHL